MISFKPEGYFDKPFYANAHELSECLDRLVEVWPEVMPQDTFRFQLYTLKVDVASFANNVAEAFRPVLLQTHNDLMSLGIAAAS